MIALALIKADTPKTDPVLAPCIAKIRKRFTSSGYEPQRMGGHDVYEAAVVAMALSNLDSEEHRGRSWTWSRSYLIGRQNANGSWDYTSRTHGRHLDLAVRRARALGGRERRVSTSRPRSGTGPRAGSCRSRPPAGAGTTTATSRSTPTPSR